MIRIEMKENGVNNAKGFGNEANIEIKGKGNVVASQLKAMFDYLDESAHKPFMIALECFFKDRLAKSGEGNIDDCDE